MARYVEVAFRQAGQLFLFDAGELDLKVGDRVIVETEHGLAIATVKTPVKTLNTKPPSNMQIFRVLYLATKGDLEREKRQQKKEIEAFKYCRERIIAHNLPMKLVKAEYLYSGSKLLFYFSAEGRIDFRLLVRDLARHFRIRIEMRQIGIRDSSKLIGGLGPCGKELCCSSFLRNFNPVSIRMAKDQNLTLNPQKVSGTCGRLMCCLSYEQDIYQAIRELMPRLGKTVTTPDGKGKVKEVLPLTKSVVVFSFETDPPTEKTYHIDQLKEYQGVSQQIDALNLAPKSPQTPKEPRRPKRGLNPIMEPKNRSKERPKTKSTPPPFKTKKDPLPPSKEKRKKNPTETTLPPSTKKKRKKNPAPPSPSPQRSKETYLDIDPSEKQRVLEEFRKKLPAEPDPSAPPAIPQHQSPSNKAKNNKKGKKNYPKKKKNPTKNTPESLTSQKKSSISMKEEEEKLQRPHGQTKLNEITQKNSSNKPRRKRRHRKNKR